MKTSNRDKVEGSLHAMKGSIKQAAGKLTDNPKLQASGVAEKYSGKIQEKVGQIKKVLGK
jgi:uncharacterized protein YjbJ (UPF0337 family)